MTITAVIITIVTRSAPATTSTIVTDHRLKSDTARTASAATTKGMCGRHLMTRHNGTEETRALTRVSPTGKTTPASPPPSYWRTQALQKKARSQTRPRQSTTWSPSRSSRWTQPRSPVERRPVERRPVNLRPVKYRWCIVKHPVERTRVKKRHVMRRRVAGRPHRSFDPSPLVGEAQSLSWGPRRRCPPSTRSCEAFRGAPSSTPLYHLSGGHHHHHRHEGRATRRLSGTSRAP